MYKYLHNVFMDIKGGEIFTLFSGWHYVYIAVAVLIGAVLIFSLKGKTYETKRKTLKVLIYIVFGIYMADFFLMPLAYGYIHIEKLPFHVCTTMCVMCFVSNHNNFLAKYRIAFTMLGFISNLVYLIYPAGVMWQAVHPLSYRVVQTLLFHGLMAVYGFLTLVYERDRIDIKKCYIDLLVVVGMVVWALIGNYSYNADVEGYSYFFNWFFVVQDPFNMFPASVAPFIMPFLNILLFCTAEMLIHGVILLYKKVCKQKLMV